MAAIEERQEAQRQAEERARVIRDERAESGAWRLVLVLRVVAPCAAPVECRRLIAIVRTFVF